jgi:hypothetical protein
MAPPSGWKLVLSLRKSLGMAEEWVYVIKRDRDGRISWHVEINVWRVTLTFGKIFRGKAISGLLSQICGLLAIELKSFLYILEREDTCKSCYWV